MSKYKDYAKSYSRMALNKKNTYASNCGAGQEGNKGFQTGNTCGGEGKGGGSEEPKKPKKSDTGAGGGSEGRKKKKPQHNDGDTVNWKGKEGTVVRYEDIEPRSPFYVVSFKGQYRSEIIPAHDLEDSSGASDTGAGEGLADEDVLYTGSGKIELPLSEEAKKDGATIHNTDMSHISDEVLNEEINQLGGDWDVENMERQDRESLMLESLAMDAEDRAFDTGAGDGVSGQDITQMDEPLMDIMRDRKQELEDSGVTTGAGDGGGETDILYMTDQRADKLSSMTAKTLVDSGESFGSKEEVLEKLKGTSIPEQLAGDIWDKMQGDTGAGDGGGVAPDTGSGGEKSWGSDSDMRVWIGSEGAYSEGKLIGEWVDATDAPSAIETLTKQWQEQGYGDEWAIMDTENVPQSMTHSPDEIADYANTLQSHDNPEALQAYADTSGLDFEDAVAQFEDAYAGEAGDMSRRGSYDLPMGFVEEYVDGTGGASEFLKNSPSPHSYINREMLVRDLSIDNRYDIQEDDEGSKVVDEDGEVVYNGSDFNDAEGWIKQSDEDLADELIESGGLSNPDFYFDYEQLAFDMVVGGDIMVSTDNNHVFWNM